MAAGDMIEQAARVIYEFDLEGSSDVIRERHSWDQYAPLYRDMAARLASSGLLANENEDPKGLAAEVNAGSGFVVMNSSYPTGADDAPDEAKVGDRPSHADLPPLRHNFGTARGGCWECGRPWGSGWVDCWIPDDLWQQISPRPNGRVDGSGHLCIHCIVKKLDVLGATDVPVSVCASPFAPQPMTVGAQEDIYGVNPR